MTALAGPPGSSSARLYPLTVDRTATANPRLAFELHAEGAREVLPTVPRSQAHDLARAVHRAGPAGVLNPLPLRAGGSHFGDPVEPLVLRELTGRLSHALSIWD